MICASSLPHRQLRRTTVASTAGYTKTVIVPNVDAQKAAGVSWRYLYDSTDKSPLKSKHVFFSE